MAYLNASERGQLLEELRGMKFGRAKSKLSRMDPAGRLAYYRNAQQAGEWHTRFILEGLGTIVTLVEINHASNDQPSNKQRFEFVNIIVEPTPANKS